MALIALAHVCLTVQSFVLPVSGPLLSTKPIISAVRKSDASGSFASIRLYESAASSMDAAANENVDKDIINPSWRSVLEIPISCDTIEKFQSIPAAKRVAIVSRVSVLHLTLLSCFGPFILRGAVRSSLPVATQMGMKLTPLLALLFTVDGLSWHAMHNLLNDWQDLDDDDSTEDSFRLAYGCHALKQGFLSKPAFLRLMATVAIPGAVLTFLFRNTVLAPAAIYGIFALFFYTIVFKPIALGEFVIYLVWGPLMAGFGNLAAGMSWAGALPLFTDPGTAIFGLAGLATIMGKHTDKITRSNKRTLPKVLGFPAALFACGATIVLPHIVLLATLLKERVVSKAIVPTIPLGACLAFLTLFREAPATLKVLRLGKPSRDEPTIPRDTQIKGTLADAQIERAWPLWFVAFGGWHAITFTYLLVLGSGAEWAGRAILSRVL